MSLRRHSRWPLAALSLAMLLPSLGTSIANVALPTLAVAFRAPFQEVQWVVIAYLLAVTTLVVVAGRLGDMFGRRRLLLAGIAIFALASAGGMLAPNLWVLVAARGAQGVGAALMMALSVASVGDMVPRDRTGSAMGLLGTVSAVGTALGPSLGGVLVSSFGWPAAFAFMTVAGAVALAVGHRVLPAEAPVTQKRSPLDVPGVLLLAVALGAYALATTLDQFTGVLGIVAAIGFVAFVVVEARAASPLVQMALFRNGALSAELAAMGLISAIMMATLVVGPFYLSESLGLDPVAPAS